MVPTYPGQTSKSMRSVNSTMPPVEGPNFRHTDPVSSLNKQEVSKSATVARDHPLRPVERCLPLERGE